MGSYEFLAGCYDELTYDVGYSAWADYIEAHFRKRGLPGKTVLDLADNWLMLVRVELTVFADNERAIHLYEKLGFEKEGLKRMTTVRDGKYADEYMMARIRPGLA